MWAYTLDVSQRWQVWILFRFVLDWWWNFPSFTPSNLDGSPPKVPLSWVCQKPVHCWFSRALIYRDGTLVSPASRASGRRFFSIVSIGGTRWNVVSGRVSDRAGEAATSSRISPPWIYSHITNSISAVVLQASFMISLWSYLVICLLYRCLSHHWTTSVALVTAFSRQEMNASTLLGGQSIFTIRVVSWLLWALIWGLLWTVIL